MNLWIINLLISFFSLLIPLYVAVAFLTLLERKVLGFRQLRLGPNKTSIYGLFQPFRDAIKLFLKILSVNYNSNKVLFLLAPALIFFLISIIWLILPHKYNMIWMFSFIMLIAALGIGVYPILWCGWASNRNYAMIGSIRGVAQTISYEISFALLLISAMILLNSISISYRTKLNYPFVFILPSIVVLITVRFIAETNRTPFDFAEGESELVSGFNVEYGSDKFAIIFLAEYGIIYTFSILTAIFFAGVHALPCWSTAVVGIFLGFFVIWLRTTLPRFRYDLLILLSWKTLLPQSLAACQLVILLYRLL